MQHKEAERISCDFPSKLQQHFFILYSAAQIRENLRAAGQELQTEDVSEEEHDWSGLQWSFEGKNKEPLQLFLDVSMCHQFNKTCSMHICMLMTYKNKIIDFMGSKFFLWKFFIWCIKNMIYSEMPS